MKQFNQMTIPEIKAVLTGLGLAVKSRLPPGTLYAVLIFDQSDIARYVSNANRSDIIKAMREHADALEKMEDTPT
jgi:hypothetical protein